MSQARVTKVESEGGPDPVDTSTETYWPAPADGKGEGDEAFLKLDGVSKSFGDTRAVREVSLEVEKGEFYSLLGPSGCGKTTLLMMLAGLVEPDTGGMTLDGKDLRRQSIQEREAAIVFQNYALFPHMTVADNVAFGLKMRRVPKSDRRDQVKAALSMVGLQDHSRRYPAQLSGGQQQRVALARAIIMRPKLLLLDEPLSNLDARLRRQLGLEIKSLQRRTGVTTIFVTHDLEEAFALSDKVAVIKDGQLQQAGASQDIYANPVSEFVADFVGHRNIWTAEARHTDARGTLVMPFPEVSFYVAARSGPQVSMALPAHKIRFGRQTEAMNVVTDTVVDEVEFIGGLLRFQCRTPSGFAIYAEAFVDEERSSLAAVAEGQTLRVGFNESDVLLIGSDRP